MSKSLIELLADEPQPKRSSLCPLILIFCSFDPSKDKPRKVRKDLCPYVNGETVHQIGDGISS